MTIRVRLTAKTDSTLGFIPTDQAGSIVVSGLPTDDMALNTEYDVTITPCPAAQQPTDQAAAAA